MSIVGSILEPFWAPKPQLSSLWGLPESLLGSNVWGVVSKVTFLWISRGRQDPEDVLGGRKIWALWGP